MTEPPTRLTEGQLETLARGRAEVVVLPPPRGPKPSREALDVVYELNKIVLRRLKALEAQFGRDVAVEGFWCWLANQGLARLLLPGAETAYPLEDEHTVSLRPEEDPDY